DDASSFAALHHRGRDSFGEVEGRVEIYRKGLMPLFVADVPEVLMRTSARDIHEDVYLSKVIEPLLHYAIHLLVVTDVSQQRKDFSAEFFAIVCDLVELRFSFARDKYEVS